MDTQEFLAWNADDQPQAVRVEATDAQGQYIVEIAGTRHTVDARRLGAGGASGGSGGHALRVGERGHGLSLIADAESHHVVITRDVGPRLGALDGERDDGATPEAVYHVLVGNTPMTIGVSDARRARLGATAARKHHKGPITLKSPMPGRISKVQTHPGETIEKGAALVTIEAMKMENEIRAPRAGTVREIMVGAGQTVDSGAPLLTIDSE
ncbi:MAG: biotin/lipoyl-binding protein [Deltaproteobacteria bacterium]|nr:biotin/lipoyl-binding protein [Deltaproteobacteria bacterium]